MNKQLNKIAQKMFGVNYNQLGTFGKWEVEDKLKELKSKKNECKSKGKTF